MNPEKAIYVGDTEDDANAAHGAGLIPILIQRDNEGNAFDFSVNKQNIKEKEFITDVKTITKLSELLTLFL